MDKSFDEQNNIKNVIQDFLKNSKRKNNIDNFKLTNKINDFLKLKNKNDFSFNYYSLL